jgi:hypothetical protein
MAARIAAAAGVREGHVARVNPGRTSMLRRSGNAESRLPRLDVAPREIGLAEPQGEVSGRSPDVHLAQQERCPGLQAGSVFIAPTVTSQGWGTRMWTKCGPPAGRMRVRGREKGP